MLTLTIPRQSVVEEIAAKAKEWRLGTVIPTGLAVAALGWATTFEHRMTVNEAEIAQSTKNNTIFYEKFSQINTKQETDRDAFRKDLKEGLDGINNKIQELTTALAVQKALADRPVHK